MSKRHRFIDLDRANIRAEEDDGKIRGLSPLYYSLSVDLGGWREMNLPGAFDWTDEDPVATFNHNFDKILGRFSAGTLEFEDGDEGLRWTIDTPDTQAGRDLQVSLKRRDVKGASYTFMPMAGGEHFTEARKADDKLKAAGVPGDVRAKALDALRGVDGGDVVSFITSGTLYEVGPVVNPAYPESDARQSRAAFEQWKEQSEKTAEAEPEGNDRDREREHRLQKQRLKL